MVWEHDTEIFRKNNSIIPTLELKQFLDTEVLRNYNQLFNAKKTWINCETDFANVGAFVFNNWLERLYFDRLERKSQDIEVLLETSKNNWEAVLFKMLIKNFGLKVNGEAFFSIANSIDFSIIRKLQNQDLAFEALLFGQSGLLEDDIEETYFLELKKEYNFLKQKFQLKNEHVIPIQFFRLRPPNFPTIRLSQLASLYNKEQNLFSKINELNTIEDFYTLFSVETSSFWKSHYTFDKASKKSKKQLTKAFIDLLMINTIIPIKFAYAKYQGKPVEENIVKLMHQISSEKNNIIDKFNSLKKVSASALQSQGLLQLKNEYCNKNKCLQCAIGNTLLNK